MNYRKLNDAIANTVFDIMDMAEWADAGIDEFYRYEDAGEFDTPLTYCMIMAHTMNDAFYKVNPFREGELESLDTPISEEWINRFKEVFEDVSNAVKPSSIPTFARDGGDFNLFAKEYKKYRARFNEHYAKFLELVES